MGTSEPRIILSPRSAADDEVSTEPLRVLESLGHAVIATDLEGTVVYWNGAAEELYGWSSAEAVGRGIATLTVPQVTQSLAAEVMRALHEGGSWSGGFTVQRKDGSTFPALVTDSGLYDVAGSLVGIVGVSTDLGHALRPLLAHASDAALMLTDEGRISYVSPAATTLFGWTDVMVLGVSLWALVHPDDRAAVQEHHVRAGTDEPSPPLECRLLCRDGSWAWVDLLVTSFLTDPAVHGLVCNLREVGDRRRDREELVRMTEQLQTALDTRVVIEQAKGLVAGRSGVDLDTAFQRIRQHARDHNAKLHEVARAVVAGEVDLST